jgi:hypothetical protein
MIEMSGAGALLLQSTTYDDMQYWSINFTGPVSIQSWENTYVWDLKVNPILTTLTTDGCIYMHGVNYKVRYCSVVCPERWLHHTNQPQR